jgi:ribosomal-protein-alanine N-acetyltransferase
MNHNDAHNYLKWFSTKEVQKFLSGLACPGNIEETIRFIDNMNGVYFTKKRTICWGIVIKESNELIGRFEICRFIRQSMAEVAYSLAKVHWNNGYMTEALRAVVKFGFETMELHRIQATAVPENEASIKILHKAGFITEGLLRKYNYGDEFRDTYIMSILKEDYLSKM